MNVSIDKALYSKNIKLQSTKRAFRKFHLTLLVLLTVHPLVLKSLIGFEIADIVYGASVSYKLYEPRKEFHRYVVFLLTCSLSFCHNITSKILNPLSRLDNGF